MRYSNPAAMILAVSVVVSWSSLTQRASAQSGALVINGETIADAETYAAAKKEGTLVIYTGNLVAAVEPVMKGFEVDTGLRVNLVRVPSEILFQRAVAEFAAGRISADYLELTDLPLIKQLAVRGVLNVTHKVPSFDRIQSALKDPEGRWYSSMRPIGLIAVNSALVKAGEEPKSWMDLLDPKWKNKIGIGSLDAGGAAFVFYAFLKEHVDNDYWSKLKAQNPRIYPSAAPTVTNLSRGEYPLAFTGAQQFISAIRSGDPVKMIVPTEGVPSYPSSGGIVTGTKRPNAARVLLNWYTSKRAGEFIKITTSYPIHPDAVPPEAPGITLPPENKLWNISIEHWEEVRVPYSAEWRKTFGQ